MSPMSNPVQSSADTSRLGVMNFLNEVAGKYPEAVSFASGRPADELFRMDAWQSAIEGFIDYYARCHALNRHSASSLIAQYGKTNGIINDLIAQQLGVDERIVCSAEQIIATAGCQEAIALCIRALCPDANDTLLVRSPTYIGVTGSAEHYGIRLAPLVCHDPADLPGMVRSEVRRLRAAGKRPRALYITPDFDNPTGTVLSLQTREQLLACCASENVVILEDNPYGMFCYEGDRLPSLAALDHYGCTIYLGTYSKTLCPAVRVGCIVVPPTLFGNAGDAQRLRERLSIFKSFLTCNTSQLTQALVGGVLLLEQGSLARLVAPALEYYRRNLRVMSEMLESTLGEFRDAVHWNAPSGGFFLTVRLPFDFKSEEAACCAAEYRAIVMPMSFFALTDDHDRWVRLAFSNLGEPQLRTGIEGFAEFVKSHL